MTFVNVGVNKGYNVADFVQRFRGSGSGNNVSNPRWLPQSIAKKSMCGICGDCIAPAPSHTVAVESVRVLGVDLIEANVKLVANAMARFNVSGSVVHRAVSNRSGVKYVPATAVPGQENYFGRDEPGFKRVGGAMHPPVNFSRAVRAVTVDELLLEEQMPHVSLLTIDTEGHDALVIEGARQALSERRVAALEFEYHAIGFWDPRHSMHRNLKSVLDRMDQWGYLCFWIGEAAIAPANGDYWCDAFEFHEWSNLACVHEPRMKRKLLDASPRATVTAAPAAPAAHGKGH